MTTRQYSRLLPDLPPNEQSASRATGQSSAVGLVVPQSTVKTRMFYARKQLAELLKKAGVDSLAAA